MNPHNGWYIILPVCGDDSISPLCVSRLVYLINPGNMRLLVVLVNKGNRDYKTVIVNIYNAVYYCHEQI